MSHIFGPGPTFTEMKMSSVLQIVVSWGFPQELFYAILFKHMSHIGKHIKIKLFHRTV